MAGRGSREVERVERETEKRTERVVVTPTRSAQTSDASSGSPTTEAPSRRIAVPDVPVPLPEPVGEATEDVKDIVDDTVGSLLP